MRKVIRFGVGAAFVLALAIPGGAFSASGSDDAPSEPKVKPHDLEHPLGTEQRQLLARALEMKLKGKIQAGAKVGKVAKGQYVQLAREGEDSIFAILGEFDDLAHNQIPEPNRTVDNATIWAEDFSRDHYLDLLFSGQSGDISMRNFYIELSSNRYTVNGDVTDWAGAPQTGAYYDDDAVQPSVCDTAAGPGVWAFLQDSADKWYADQLASGKTSAQIDTYLSQFDTGDRYDFDGDGNFAEPDGYIDHFESVHAGMGEEVGGGVLGGQAIWSHRWYACFGLIGSAGPSPDYLLGGLQIGNSNYWIGDYTIQPENGGVGVFAHEFGHDLGLPDLYDIFGGENSTGFWTLMSSGSYGNDGTVDIGSKPIHMGNWEKFQLGWLNYEVGFAGKTSSHRLGPAETSTKQAQGLFVVLPDKEVTVDLGPPYAGSNFFYSGSGDNLDNRMYKQFNLASGSSLTAQVRYDIELDWDYAYLVVSTNGGATWTNVATNHSTNTSPNGQNFGEGITGSTGGNWVTLSADLSAFTGNVLVGFRYWTDGAVAEPGFMVDELSITGHPTEGAESDVGWTFDGFTISDGTETGFHFNAYVVENRQYLGYDLALKTGPYNFGFLDNSALQNWVERFPYQDGVLISYWDNSFGDNSTVLHPGGGLILPIDSHPTALIRPGGAVWRSRIQSYDSTFGLQPTDAITLHRNSVEVQHPSLPAAPVFNDSTDYWDPSSPLSNVITPDTGTTIRVKSLTPGGFAQVEVKPAK